MTTLATPNPALQADVLIITALKEEYDEAKKVDEGAVDDWTETQVAETEVSFRTYRTVAGKELRVALTWATRMRTTATALTAGTLLDRLGVSCIAMAGVCAGRRGKVRPGDVIIGSLLYTYDTGAKHVEVDSDGVRRERFQNDPNPYPLDEEWLRRAKAFRIPTDTVWLADRPPTLSEQCDWVLDRLLAGDDPKASSETDWRCPAWSAAITRLRSLKYVKSKGPLALTISGKGHIEEVHLHNRGSLPSAPAWSVHVAPIATGNSVMRDPQLFDNLSDSMRTVLGVEMEAAAIAAVAHAQKLRWLVMKGVMDHADHDKDDQLKLFAARASAECLLRFLREYPPVDDGGLLQAERERIPSAAGQVLDSLAESMRSRTRTRLEPRTGVSSSVHIDRIKARTDFREAVKKAAGDGVLLVTGEPGVGKSALALEVVTELGQQGQAALTMISLRDLGDMTAIQLEHALGVPLARAFGTTAVAPLRLLLLDGAEATQERRDRVFGDLVRAANSAGLLVIAVTRQDAEDNVASILSSSTDKPSESIERHVVEGFSMEETVALVAQFPQLKRLAEHPGSQWLLRRPGLLKLVLEDDVLRGLPDGPLSEAVVHFVIWRNLIRRSERLDADHATADGRAAIILSLARRLLLPGSTGGTSYPDPYALPSLRSDGVLLPMPKGFVWRASEEFASDLLRDIAVTQQLLQEPQLLVDAKAPRWTLHATRVFLQALLMQGGREPLGKLAGQIAFCHALAQQHGARWADLPWEALLTASEPSALLEAQWAFLQENDGKELHDLLRVLTSRFGESGQISADIGASVVRLLCDHYQEVISLRGDLSESIEKCLRGWLRSLASKKNQDIPDLLRARIRDLFLFNHQYQHDEWYVECLGLLGPDLNEEAERRLRSLAQTWPETLHPCLETVSAPWSMSVHRPELLLDIAKSYYIESQNEETEHLAASRHRRSPCDDGVRDHRNNGSWPSTAWYYGPFYALLHSKISGKVITFINQLLDHAARIRVAPALEAGIASYLDEAGVDIGIEVDVPTLGRRKYIGDSHVWRWYRGTSVGPYPCMSALMALEVVTDKFHAAGVPLRELSIRLLGEANNLAMAGFVYGMIVRLGQPDTDLLDPWLARPEVWRLETFRTMHDQIRQSFAESAEVKNSDRRRYDPITVSYWLTTNAILTKDDEAVKRLASLSERLVENGQQLVAKQSEGTAGSDGKRPSRRLHDLLTVRRWAGSLVASNYEFIQAPDGISLDYVAPAEITQAIQERSQDLLRGQQLYHIQHRYCKGLSDAPVSPEQVKKDLADIVQFIEQAPESGPPFPLSAPAALALTAIRKHFAGELVLDAEELSLAAVISIKSAEPEFPLSPVEDVSYLGLGADRSAAHALPLMLLPSFDLSSLDPEDVQKIHELAVQALKQLAQSPVVEARAELAEGLRSIWEAPCGGRPEAAGVCTHRIAFEIVTDAARYCRVKAGGFSEIDPLPEPFEQSVQTVDPDDLLLSRLAVTVGILGDAAGSGCCAAKDAFHLLPVSAGIYGKVAALGNGIGQLVVEETQHLVSGGLLRASLTNDAAPLLQLLDSVSRNYAVATQLLHSLCLVASYGQKEREALAAGWPSIIVRLLDAVEQGGQRPQHDDSYERVQLLAALLPRPRPRRDERAMDALIEKAGTGWLHPTIVAPLMVRWLSLVTGVPNCVDAIAWFLLHQPIRERLQFGLPWIERAIGRHSKSVAKHTRILVSWLTATMASDALSMEDKRRIRQLIDGLAAHGDAEALAAQRAEESQHGGTALHL